MNTQCLACKDGFREIPMNRILEDNLRINQAGPSLKTCKPCGLGCKRCPASETVCTECMRGFFGTSTCTACVANCDVCQNATECVTCSLDYELNAQKTCIAKPFYRTFWFWFLMIVLLIIVGIVICCVVANKRQSNYNDSLMTQTNH